MPHSDATMPTKTDMPDVATGVSSEEAAERGGRKAGWPSSKREREGDLVV